MGQVAPTSAFSSVLTVEVVSTSGTWTPPRQGMTVFVEPCGGGQSGGYVSSAGVPGESGDLGYGIFRNVTGPLTICRGAGGAPPAAGGAPVVGNDTGVTYAGATYTGLGGGKGGKRVGKPGSASAGGGSVLPGTEGIAVVSLILRAPAQRSPGSFSPSQNLPANGGPSILASGGLVGAAGTLGSGGGSAPSSGTLAGAGGDGFVLIGYYEVPA